MHYAASFLVFLLAYKQPSGSNEDVVISVFRWLRSDPRFLPVDSRNDHFFCFLSYFCCYATFFVQNDDQFENKCLRIIKCYCPTRTNEYFSILKSTYVEGLQKC